MKKRIKAGLVGLAAGVISLGSATALGNYLYDLVMVPKGHDPAKDTDPQNPIFLGRRWLREHPARRTAAITAVDGLTLRAHVLRAPGREEHRWAVCVHCYGDSAEAMGHIARRYAEMGWNVLLPDLRGHGESEGDYVGFGWDDRLDLVAWCSWLIRRHPKAQIVLHGVSMGAAAVLMTAGGPLPSQVRAVVSDCAYTSAKEILRHIYQKQERKYGPYPAVWGALRAAVRRRAKFDLAKADAAEAVRRSVTPTLFIHGVADNFVPPSMMAELYEQAKCPKDHLWVQGAAHARCAVADPELYWSTVDAFLSPLLNAE